MLIRRTICHPHIIIMTWCMLPHLLLQVQYAGLGALCLGLWSVGRWPELHYDGECVGMAVGLVCQLLSHPQGTYAGQFVMEGFLGIRWARWKRVLLTRSVAMVPCVVIAIVAVNSLDYLDEYINVEQSMLVSDHSELTSASSPQSMLVCDHSYM